MRGKDVPINNPEIIKLFVKVHIIYGSIYFCLSKTQSYDH